MTKGYQSDRKMCFCTVTSYTNGFGNFDGKKRREIVDIVDKVLCCVYQLPIQSATGHTAKYALCLASAFIVCPRIQHIVLNTKGWTVTLLTEDCLLHIVNRKRAINPNKPVWGRYKAFGTERIKKKSFHKFSLSDLPQMPLERLVNTLLHPIVSCLTTFN